MNKIKVLMLMLCCSLFLMLSNNVLAFNTTTNSTLNMRFFKPNATTRYLYVYANEGEEIKINLFDSVINSTGVNQDFTFQL